MKSNHLAAATVPNQQATLDSTVAVSQTSSVANRDWESAISRSSRYAHLIDLVLINDQAEAVNANNVYYQKVYARPPLDADEL